jgi:hypothetical protein
LISTISSFRLSTIWDIVLYTHLKA